MNPVPEVKPLPYKRRQYLLVCLCVVFLVLLPILMFYATGYRFSFNDDEGNLVSSTGGLYISAPHADMQIFVDEEPVRNIRVFRRASFVQNLNEGVHRLNVQRADLQTWTKDLPVYPHIVTEAAAFNMPMVPQIRVITPYVTATGTAVVASGTEPYLPFASTTNDLFFATNTATTSYVANPEYAYVETLFGTTSTSSEGLIARVVGEVEAAFEFATSLGTTSTTTATSTVSVDDMTLYENGRDVYAHWEGTINAIPYYFCVDHVSASTTALRYGEHVLTSITPILLSTSTEHVLKQNNRTRVCRSDIRIDRLRQDVYSFDFLPGSSDHALMLLAEGLYVVEIDDRSWQNTQLLFPGENLHMRTDGGRIYIFDGSQYLEVLTEIE